MKARLAEVVRFCNERARVDTVADFPGAFNGLQFENRGTVTRIGAAVDAGLVPFQKAAAAGIDFLIVHHGLFWKTPIPMTGVWREKFAVLHDHNMAVYGCHLPLDCHPEIGNNALLAKAIGLNVSSWFLKYEGNPMAARIDAPGLSRQALRERLRTEFPAGFTAIEEGPDVPRSIGILTGSGRQAADRLHEFGVDTLITGELKQEHFNLAQEHRLNLYCCGHYATETYGVKALAAEAAAAFGLPWEFVPTGCPL